MGVSVLFDHVPLAVVEALETVSGPDRVVDWDGRQVGPTAASTS
ncbi:MAG: hypothetical protein ABEH58_03490 [Haloplanus sp.]